MRLLLVCCCLAVLTEAQVPVIDLRLFSRGDEASKTAVAAEVDMALREYTWAGARKKKSLKKK
jgi:hypothetical protein